MATIRDYREKLLQNAEIAAMIIPSAKFEIYLDLNDDGKADFALIDTGCNLTGKGDMDTIAIDLGNDGEFDLYLRDTDGNWVADEITYFKDGELDPVIQTHPEKSREMIEAALATPSVKVIGALKMLGSGETTAAEFKAAMQEYVMSVRLALRNVYAAYMKSKQ